MHSFQRVNVMSRMPICNNPTAFMYENPRIDQIADILPEIIRHQFVAAVVAARPNDHVVRIERSVGYKYPRL